MKFWKKGAGLLLALVLCLTLTVPALAAGPYTPYTTPFPNLDGTSTSELHFDAVRLQVREVTLIDNGRPETTQMLCVLAKPGSHLSCNGSCLTVPFFRNPDGSYQTTTSQGIASFGSIPENAVTVEEAMQQLHLAAQLQLTHEKVDLLMLESGLLLLIDDGKAGVPNSFSFIDVPLNAYYLLPVAWAVASGITKGTTATTFSPNQICNQAQIITFLWRSAGSPIVEAEAHPFTGIMTEQNYFYHAALWAYSNEIIDASFSPYAPCTRGLAVTYLYNLFERPAVTYQGQFSDITGTPYEDAVAWAVKHGITKGTTETTFSPEKTCTRGNIVTFLYRGNVDLEGVR